MREVMKALGRSITDALALIRHLYSMGHVKENNKKKKKKKIKKKKKKKNLEVYRPTFGDASALVGVNSRYVAWREERRLSMVDSRKHLRIIALQKLRVQWPLNGPEGRVKLSYIQQRKSVHRANAEVGHHRARGLYANKAGLGATVDHRLFSLYTEISSLLF